VSKLMRGAIPPLPNTSSWRVVELSIMTRCFVEHRGNCTFTVMGNFNTSTGGNEMTA